MEMARSRSYIVDSNSVTFFDVWHSRLLLFLNTDPVRGEGHPETVHIDLPIFKEPRKKYIDVLQLLIDELRIHLEAAPIDAADIDRLNTLSLEVEKVWGEVQYIFSS